MEKISAIIISLNEEKQIGDCIKSLLPVADEIIVVDSFSKDKTVEIATNLGAKVLSKDWEGFSATKNWGNSQATYDYILSIDSDERLDESLQKSILEAKHKGLSGGYKFNRLNWYIDTWIKHSGWYPDDKVRLFHRNEAKWIGDHVHETLDLTPNTTVNHLEGDLLHYTYFTTARHLAKIERYSSLAAEKNKSKSGIALLLKAIVSPITRFVRMYFFQLGFLDGKRGLQLCYYTAKEVQLKYSKALSLKRLG